MIFTEIDLYGAFVIDLEPIEDERGFFARAWCRREFEERGLETSVAQWNMSLSKRKGTLRGLHFQVPPHEEVKVMRCIRGALYDVIVDLRADSPTFKQWTGNVLSAENRRMLYVPAGCAHGYQTLEDQTEALYTVSQFYVPESERGIRWDDPSFDIQWPELEHIEISHKDRNWPDYAG